MMLYAPGPGCPSSFVILLLKLFPMEHSLEILAFTAYGLGLYFPGPGVSDSKNIPFDLHSFIIYVVPSGHKEFLFLLSFLHFFIFLLRFHRRIVWKNFSIKSLHVLLYQN